MQVLLIVIIWDITLNEPFFTCKGFFFFFYYYKKKKKKEQENKNEKEKVKWE